MFVVAQQQQQVRATDQKITIAKYKPMSLILKKFVLHIGKEVTWFAKVVASVSLEGNIYCVAAF